MAGEIRQTVGRLAVAHPTVGFRLCDGARNATVLRTSRTGLSLTAYRQVEKGCALPPMARLEFSDGEFEIDGHLTIPPDGQLSRELQLFCLNGRPMSSRTAVHREPCRLRTPGRHSEGRCEAASAGSLRSVPRSAPRSAPCRVPCLFRIVSPPSPNSAD